MRTGVSYMGHHNPKHMKSDMEDLKRLGCDDLLLAAQENDFAYMNGKLNFLPKIAKDRGMKPIVIFWGLLNLFGGGKSSQFLLGNPGAHQVCKDGSWHPEGCYNNPVCLEYTKQLISRTAQMGFEGYFIDEPTGIDCYCPSCRRKFESMFSRPLEKALPEAVRNFRKKCVIDYIRDISEYTKNNHPQMETFCCLMPVDRAVWKDAAKVLTIDNLGTDIYWANEDNDVDEMRPLIKELAGFCKKEGKKHHQWLQAWGVKKGKEERIRAQGRILINEKPDALYVWAYEGQVGTNEACEDPVCAWEAVCEILKKAKEING
ncbi:MAG: hypothetical protein ABII75_00745 [Candidatus Omnitrophota bacterium]